MTKLPVQYFYPARAQLPGMPRNFVPAGYLSLTDAFNLLGRAIYPDWTGAEICARYSCNWPLPSDHAAIRQIEHSGPYRPSRREWEVYSQQGWIAAATKEAAENVWKTDQPLIVEARQNEIMARGRFEKIRDIFRLDLSGQIIRAVLHNLDTGNLYKVENNFWGSNEGGRVLEIPDRYPPHEVPGKTKIGSFEGFIVLPVDFLDAVLAQRKATTSPSEPKLATDVKRETPPAFMIAWSSVDLFTVEQAAALWAGVDPSKGEFFIPAEERSRLIPRKQMLVGAILEEKLPAQTAHNTLRTIGNHDNSMVSREALVDFAIQRGERPLFLFDTLLADRGDAPNVSGPDQPRSAKNRGGRPPEYDWNAMTIEIVRIADLDALPEKQSDLVRSLQEWFQRTHGEEPAESAIKTRVSSIYRGLGRGQKPKAG